MKRSERVVAQLVRARERRTLVRVTREIAGADRVEGYIAAVGRKWVLVAVPDDRTRPDGYKAIRVRDVEAVWRHAAGERVMRRSLRLQRAWPLGPPGTAVDLDSTAGLVRSLADGFPLLSVFIERDDPDVCFIGRLTERPGRHLTLDEISPRGRWEGVFRARLGRISRVDVGGGYEAALLAVAGKHRT